MQNNKNNNTFLLFFIIFLTSFVLGFISALNYKISYEKQLGKTGIIIDKSVEKNKELNLTKFYKVYNKIKNVYFDTEKIDNTKLLESAISGLVKGLGDKNSSYFTKEENESFTESLTGDFEGIGAVIEENPLGVKIDLIIKGSPAKKYGLKKDDIIISADGKSLEGLSSTEAVKLIKGKAGTKVSLEILRPGEKNILKKEIIREKIVIPSIQSENIDNEIGYISINSFMEKTGKDFKEALNEMKDKKGIIIDLRDNGGGFLETAVEILSNFVKKGEILVTTKYRDISKQEKFYSKNDGNIYKGKIVILVNENSASASEITSLTLKEYNKAILVGKKTYGKGSVQIPFELGDGSMVKLTIAKWFTPNDKNIDGEGISPDIKIDFKKEDYNLEECKKVGKCDKNLKEEDFKGYDRQKEEAKKILKSFIKKDALQLTIDDYNETQKVEK